MRVLTPGDVEKRFNELSIELDEAQQELEGAESEYYLSKVEHELAWARKFLSLKGEEQRRTVGELDAEATLGTEHSARRLAAASARQRSSRSNVDRIKVQIDLARSLGTSVRAALEL